MLAFLARWARAGARLTGRVLAGVPLVVLYAVGVAAGAVAVAAVTCAAAVRLGWVDARKWGSHGPA